MFPAWKALQIYPTSNQGASQIEPGSRQSYIHNKQPANVGCCCLESGSRLEQNSTVERKAISGDALSSKPLEGNASDSLEGSSGILKEIPDQGSIASDPSCFHQVIKHIHSMCKTTSPCICIFAQVMYVSSSYFRATEYLICFSLYLCIFIPF